MTPSEWGEHWARQVTRVIGRPDPVTLAEKLDIDIRWTTRDGRFDGILAVHEDVPGGVVLLNRIQHPKRQQFTLAHELGHFILHGKHHKRWRCKMGTPSRLEWEANRFAVEFLMPIFYMRFILGSCGNDIGLISQRLGLSRDAVSIRLEEMSLEHYQQGRLFKSQNISQT